MSAESVAAIMARIAEHCPGDAFGVECITKARENDEHLDTLLRAIEQRPIDTRND